MAKKVVTYIIHDVGSDIRKAGSYGFLHVYLFTTEISLFSVQTRVRPIMEGVELMQSALSTSGKNSAIAYPDMWKKTNHVFVSVKFHEN